VLLIASTNKTNMEEPDLLLSATIAASQLDPHDTINAISSRKSFPKATKIELVYLNESKQTIV
jgi:hypothetical protein